MFRFEIDQYDVNLVRIASILISLTIIICSDGCWLTVKSFLVNL